MKVEFEIVFACEAEMKPHLEKIFSGDEYGIPVSIPQGSHILDLGANSGAFSVWASHRWPGCTIDAFEPHPKTFKLLEGNTKNYPNIRLHNWGIGNPGWRVLKDGPNNSGEATFHEMFNNEGATGQHVEVKSPETLPPCNLMKLDIEACEVEVLRPYIESGKRPEIIMLEYHSEKIRRQVDHILQDYAVIGSDVQSIFGRGVVKYMHVNLLKEFING